MSDDWSERDELAAEDESLRTVYARIVTAALRRMDADVGSMQVLDRADGELRLLSTSGFSEDAQHHWARVKVTSSSACGLALASGKRIAIEDVEASSELVGTRDLELYRAHDIRSIVSMPLRVRGRVMGMVTVHWKRVHLPTPDGLRRLDELAREAADLIAWREREEALRANSERLTFLLALTDALRQQDELETLCGVASRMIGEHFDADRALVSDIDAVRGVTFVHCDWARAGLSSITGAHTRAPVPEILTSLGKQQPLIIDDVRSCPFVSEAVRDAFLRLGAQAVAIVPLVADTGDGLSVSLMTEKPRRWTTNEIILLHEAADRIRASERRLRAEVGQRTREELLEITFASSNIGRFIWDIVTHSIEVDDDLRDVLGIAPGEAATIGHLAARVHPDDLERHSRNVHAALDPKGSGTLRSTSRIIHADGTVRVVSCYGRVLFDGEPRRPVRMLGTVLPHEDEAARERAHEQHASEVVSRAGFVEASADGVLTLVSSRFAAMLGCSSAELVGKTVLEISAPQDRAASARVLERVAAGEAALTHDKSYLRRDGSMVAARCTTSALRDHAGAFVGYVALIVEKTWAASRGTPSPVGRKEG